MDGDSRNRRNGDKMLAFDYKEAAKKYYVEPAGEHAVGYIPFVFSSLDPRPAREQIDANYAHGGGFFELGGFVMLEDRYLKYPGEPKMPVLAEAQLRDETILVYPSALVAVVQKDGSYSVTRMD